MTEKQSSNECLPCFKAYDIRGRVPEELDEDVAYRIGRAYAQFLDAKRVVVGRDVRLSSQGLCDALCRGLAEGGADVFDLGLCGTEEVYFATFAEQMDGGIMVTASHNPPDYNGMKLVREKAKPISGDSGLETIRQAVAENTFAAPTRKGDRVGLDVRAKYLEHLLGYVDVRALRPFKVVVNAGNGCAGPVLDALESRLPFSMVKVHHRPDGTFPNGVPNPLLPENRHATIEAIKQHGADVGIAWDGDFDRCFLFDERGRFVEGYYIVGLLAATCLKRYPGGRIIHDPRLTWNTIDTVRKAGGVPVQSKTGHAFIKERMRAEDAVYGGEMSAHHYFKEFSYCDSGMIPWLMILEAMSESGRPLSELVGQQIRSFPASGEINRRHPDPQGIMAAVEARYAAGAVGIDRTDGLSVEFPFWRFNLRRSNTEPVLRLNVESRGDASLMEEKTEELLGLIGGATT